MKLETVPLASISPDPANTRKHSRRNLDAIKASLRRFGQQKPIVVDGKGVVLAGNGTLAAATELGWTEIQIVRTELAGVDATAFGIADNRTAELAEWDENLGDVLAALKAEDFPLAEIGFDEADLAELAGEPEPSDADAEPQIDKAEELRGKWGVELGQVWQLGDHRIACGDSTNKEAISKLLNGEKIDLCFTSPPYNSKDGGYKTNYHGETKKFYNHACDDRTEEEWVLFCDKILTIIAENLRTEESPVVWNVMYTANCRSGYGKTMFAGTHKLSVKETICWDKKAGFPTASKGILSRNWELIFVLSKGEKYTTTQGSHEPRWAKWEIARPKQHEVHKATFPIELAEKAISDFSLGGVVYEPFLGSGTTLMASEKLNRKCYAMELSPAYVAVAIQRWADATGKEPRKL